MGRDGGQDRPWPESLQGLGNSSVYPPTSCRGMRVAIGTGRNHLRPALVPLGIDKGDQTPSLSLRLVAKTPRPLLEVAEDP